MKFKVYLGTTKSNFKESVYLTGFNWECGWYWGGGHIQTKSMSAHFNHCFLDEVDIRGHPLGNFCTPWNKKEGFTEINNGCSLWEDLNFFVDNGQFTSKEWWTAVKEKGLSNVAGQDILTKQGNDYNAAMVELKGMA